MIKFTLASPWVNCGVCQVMSEEELGCTEEEWLALDEETQEQQLQSWKDNIELEWFWQQTSETEETDLYNC